MSQTTTIKVGESAKTIPLPEGKSLVLTGNAGAVGVAYLLDPVLGGTNSSKSWAVAAGVLAPIGPYSGTQKIQLTCSKGAIDATVQDALLSVASAGSAAPIITGTPGVNKTLTATLPAGVIGTLQWTRTTKAVPPVKSNIASAVANAVNSLTYVQQQADVGCFIGCDASSQVSPSSLIDCPANVPDAPTIGALTASTNSVSQAFTAPANNGGAAITNYQLSVYRASDNVLLGQANGSASPLALAGLANDIAVYGKVASQNSVGYGAQSAASNTATPSAVTTINALSSVTLFGDSLMANGNPVVTGSGPAQGGETSVSHVGWTNDTMRKAGIGIDAIQLRAVGGTTIKQHIANQLPSVLTDTSVGAWYHGGVNSYNDSITTPLGGPYTQATNIADATNVIQQLAAAKAFVIVDAIQPVSQAGSTGAKSRATEFPAHNAAIKAVCDSLPNVIYLDLYNLLVDPASGQLNPLPNLILASDGIHYTTQGARLVGDYVAAQLASKLNLTRYKTAGANLLPDFSTTGGTTTPGSGTINGAAALANNWNCAITSGAASVTLSNPVAGTLRLTISNPGGSASSIVLSALNTSALLAAVANGDTIQGGFDFSTVGTSTNLTRISCAFRTNGSTGTLWNAMTRDLANEPSGDFKYNQSASSGRRWLHPRAVPAMPTAVDFLITIAVDPVGAAVVDISLPTLFKLT
jgi:hypothetical protein